MLAEQESLARVPVKELRVKCLVCKQIIPALQGMEFGCKCGAVQAIEADGEVIKIRHRSDTEHGLKPFEVVRA